MPELEEEKQQNKYSKVVNVDSTKGTTMLSNSSLQQHGGTDAGSRHDSDNGSTSGKSTGSDHEVSKRKLSPLHYGTGWEASLMVRKSIFHVLLLTFLFSFLCMFFHSLW